MPTPADFAAAENLRAAILATDDDTGRYLLDADTVGDVATLYGLDASVLDMLRDLIMVDESRLNVLAKAGTAPDADVARSYNHPVAVVATLRAAFHIPPFEEYVMHQRTGRAP